MPVSTALERVRALLDGGDLRGAVILLNSLAPHRFTSLFRFDGDMLRTVVFFDRDNPTQAVVDDIPVAASYCVFVREGGSTFTVPDAACDPRVNGHPKQSVFRAYCGVPLIDAAGRMHGTVCHFDFDPHPDDIRTVDLLESVAPFLARTV